MLRTQISTVAFKNLKQNLPTTSTGRFRYWGHVWKFVAGYDTARVDFGFAGDKYSGSNRSLNISQDTLHEQTFVDSELEFRSNYTKLRITNGVGLVETRNFQFSRYGGLWAGKNWASYQRYVRTNNEESLPLLRKPLHSRNLTPSETTLTNSSTHQDRASKKDFPTRRSITKERGWVVVKANTE